MTIPVSLDIILHDYAAKIKQELKSTFVGFYLQGSLAIGDFDLTSDVDFIVVTKQDLHPIEVAKIQHIHTETYGQNNHWVKHFEYSFFPLNILHTPSSPFINGQRNDVEDRKLWYFNNGSTTIERSDHCNTLVTRWTLKEKGITLLGPDIRSIIDPVNQKDLKTEIKNTMIGWAKDIATRPNYVRNRFYQSYLVLNYARMLQDLFEGKITSKREGVEWAKQNIDQQWIPLLDFCWRERQDTTIAVTQPIDSKIFKQTLEFVEYTTSIAVNYVHE